MLARGDIILGTLASIFNGAERLKELKELVEQSVDEAYEDEVERTRG